MSSVRTKVPQPPRSDTGLQEDLSTEEEEAPRHLRVVPSVDYFPSQPRTSMALTTSIKKRAAQINELRERALSLGQVCSPIERLAKGLATGLARRLAQRVGGCQ